MKLTEIEERIQILQDTLESMDGISSEEEIALVQKMLDDMEGNREEKLLNVARWRKQLANESKEVIGAEVKRLQDRKKSYDRKIEGISNYLHYGLEQIGGKLKSPLGSLNIQNNPPSTKITDPASVPKGYWVDMAEVDDCGLVELGGTTYFVGYHEGKIYFSTIDKKAITEQWKATGEDVAGTKTTQGTHVRFR